jgi:hypothetical protein
MCEGEVAQQSGRVAPPPPEFETYARNSCAKIKNKFILLRRHLWIPRVYKSGMVWRDVSPSKSIHEGIEEDHTYISLICFIVLQFLLHFM